MITAWSIFSKITCMKSKTIALTNGGEAIVDDDLFEHLNQHNWQRSSNGSAYRCTMVDGVRTNILMHRVVNNTPENCDTDHINRNKLDNRRCNLRTATTSQNSANRPKWVKNSSSRFKGVHWCNRVKAWISRIRVNYKMIYLGTFTNETDAASAYNKAAKLHFGEFAVLNEVQSWPRAT